MADQKKRRGIVSRVLFLLFSFALIAAILYFGRYQADSAVPGDLVLVTEAPQVDVLMPGDHFTGLLRIRDHKGKGFLKNESFAVHGLIDRAEGRTFLELYDQDDPEGTSPLLSMWVRLDYDTVIPVIGEHDARFFYVWLDERDVDTFTMKLVNGRLSASFLYNDGSESCVIDFTIKQENNT